MSSATRTPAELDARRRAHETFDKLWKDKFVTRKHAYSWLSNHIGVPRGFHFSTATVAECERVIRMSRIKYNELHRRAGLI